MAGIDHLIQTISELDSGWKIAGFVISALLIFATILRWRKGRISDRNTTLIVVVMLLIGLAPIIASLVPHPVTTPTAYKITIVVDDSSHRVYNSEEANVFVNNVDAIPIYSAAARAWEFTIAMDAFPKDRGMIISAESRIRKANLQKRVQLTDEIHQDFELTFPVPPLDSGRGRPGHGRPTAPTSFSINLDDPSIRQGIAAHTDYQYNSVSPTYRIVVGYDTSSLVYRSTSDTWIFKESSPLVSINGQSRPLSGCVIPASLPTHEKERASAYGRQQATEVATAFLKDHPTTLAQWIKR